MPQSLRVADLRFESNQSHMPIPLALENKVSIDYFEFFSPRLMRAVEVAGRHRFEFALLCEFDSTIAAYCERPGPSMTVEVRGKSTLYTPAFWVRKISAREQLIAVEEVDKFILDATTGERVPRDWFEAQSAAQQHNTHVALVTDAEIVRNGLLIENIQTIIPLVTRACQFKDSALLESVFQEYSQGIAFTLAEVAASFPRSDTDLIYGTVFYLIQRRYWTADINHARVGRQLVVIPASSLNEQEPPSPES